MRLTEFHQYLTSNGPDFIREGTFTMEDALQLAKSVLPTAVRSVDYEDLYPCVFVSVFGLMIILFGV